MRSANDKAKPADPTSWSTTHPLSPRDAAVVAQMRTMAAPTKGKLRGVTARAPFDAIIGHTLAPEAVSFREDKVGGVPGWWCDPSEAPSTPNAAVLHLHGGWFNWGSAEAYRHLVGHIARTARTSVFIPDYRLAPEHPFPAAIEDAQAVFRGLLIERGLRAVAVTGDSAGGNLALSLVSILASGSANNVRPVAAAVISPITDLGMTGPSWQTRAVADPYFVREQADGLISAYLNGRDPSDPIASPLYGNFKGLPPIRIHVGDDEVLLDDSLRYIKRAVDAGADAAVDVWEGMPHGFVGAVGHLEAADSALRAIGTFLASHLVHP